MCAILRVCVCVCERERERIGEKERLCTCMCMHASNYIFTEQSKIHVPGT